MSAAIVVLTYNHPDITDKCLSSILAVVPLLPVCVIHNGSETKNITLTQNKYPQFKHIIIEKNHGYASGANHGLQEAFKHYENVLFLTNDTELLQWPPEIPKGFCSITIRKRNTEHIDSILGEVHLKYGRLKHLKEEKDIVTRPYRSLYIPGTAFWMERKIFEKLQGFDESFHTYWEDVDLSYRAISQNLKVGCSLDTIVKHKIGKTCHKNDFYTYYLFQRNRKKFILKHGYASILFWMIFIFDITKYCKYRFKYLWRILHD